MNQHADLEGMNQLLKGSYMGESIFQDLKENLKNQKLISEFGHFLSIFQMHKDYLQSYVEKEGGTPSDDAGVMGSITDFLFHMKTMTITSDEEIISQSIDHMAMAIKALDEFEKRHSFLEVDEQKILSMMMHDYQSIYSTLKRIAIEFHV